MTCSVVLQVDYETGTWPFSSMVFGLCQLSVDDVRNLERVKMSEWRADNSCACCELRSALMAANGLRIDKAGLTQLLILIGEHP